MNRPAVRLPNFLIEDYLGILRTIVLLAWTGLLSGLAVQAWVRLSPDMSWPTLGGFDKTYNFVLLEFGLNTLLLTLLLVKRDWFERVPRDAAYRVRWLLVAVVIWAGLHHLAAFHVTGSMAGPMLPMLPVLLIGAVLVFPPAGARIAAAYVIAGHLLVILLEQQSLIHPRGQLADAFAFDSYERPLGMVTLLVTLGVAGTMAWFGRQRLDEAGAALHRGSRINPLTGLYEQDFLMERLHAELSRARRQGGATTLMFIELEGFSEFTAQHGYDAGRLHLRRAAQAVIGSVRLEFDAPARYAPTTFAVLLPNSTGEEARKVAGRIRDLLAQDPAVGDSTVILRFGMASSASAESMDAPRMIAVASAAVGKARDGGRDLEIVAATPR